MDAGAYFIMKVIPSNSPCAVCILLENLLSLP